MNRTARDADRSNCPDCLTHAMVNVGGCEIPKNVLHADTIVVICGLRSLNSLPGRRIVIMDSGDRMKSSTRRRTTTSLFAVSRTTSLECAMVVQYGRCIAESSMFRTRQEPEETHWSNSEDHEVHFGIRELPRGAQSSVWRDAWVLLEQKHRDHDMQEWTTPLCCKR